MSAKGPSIQGVTAIVIGNMLEWFDFGIFAFMTPIISSVFFPVDPKIPGSEINAILATTAILAPGSSCGPSAPSCWGSTGTGRGGRRR